MLRYLLNKKACFLWAKLNTQDLKRILRQESHLLVLKTNFWGFLFSQESHPLRINIAFSEHISPLRISCVGISYCTAVTYPAGLLLLGCTWEKREELLQLAEMLCPNYYSSLRSNGPPQCWPLESRHLQSVHSWRSRMRNGPYSGISKISNAATPGVSFINFFLFFSLASLHGFWREGERIKVSFNGEVKTGRQCMYSLLLGQSVWHPLRGLDYVVKGTEALWFLFSAI